MFRSIIDEKIKIISKKKNYCTIKRHKKKKVYVDSIKVNSMKSVHLKEIVTRVAFLRFIYVVVCSIVNVMIENIKIKAMFDNGTEINCMFKWLIDAAQLFVRQNINIIIINVTDERARFFNVCEAVFINIDSIMISISAFVMKRSDYEFLLKKFFQRAAHMSSININNESFEMILLFWMKRNEWTFWECLLNMSAIKKKSQCLQWNL